MAKDSSTYSDALVGKDVPVLFKDQKWQDLFVLSPKTARIKQLEAELIKLVATQEKTREKIKDIKRLKKKLLGEIVVLRDDADKNPKQRKKIEAEIDDHTRLIKECNEKIEECEDNMLGLPREIYQANFKLMIETMNLFYKKMHDNTVEIDAIDEWVSQVRVKLKKNVIRLQEKEIENFNVYSYMHNIFGPEVIDLFDLKYDPDKRHPVLKAGMKEQDGIIVEDEKFTDS
ncbi:MULTISPECIES: hypothetical protein [unclassified Butyrivibrio]|jgi:hypothetical protein|uniref:hypothetical protein n=1 Tax=unclassified Butyrivibrio TaxID=2639466 RepID=UPI0004200D49|nr:MULTISPECIES: hypothetical protein [unclassified Butyrivibrio]MCR5342749.1 hypothetical protein [Butyrivibrio sp.]